MHARNCAKSVSGRPIIWRDFGRRVLTYALEIASQADCYKVHLATGSKRETTLRFYEEAGFERGGKTYFEVRR